MPTPQKDELPGIKTPTKTEIDAMKFVPDLIKDFGFTQIPVEDKRACLQFTGGEEHGLKRLEDYLF